MLGEQFAFFFVDEKQMFVVAGGLRFEHCPSYR
jgi:hypothetical protein